MIYLGLSAYYHDSAAAIIQEGNILAAAQEERFSRKKHDERFPFHAIDYCLKAANLKLAEVDHIVFYEKPFLKFERLLETYLATVPFGFNSFRKAMPLWIKEKLFQKKKLLESLNKIESVKSLEDKLLFVEHHQSHASSAFFPSPFKEAVILTMDGVGEWATSSVGIGRDNTISLKQEMHFPHSLGLLYSAFTYYTGFKVNSGEYKVMGLAPYGQPKYVDKIYEHLIDLKPDGSFRLNQKYFSYMTDLKMTNTHFHDLFGGPPRQPESLVTQREMDLAASIQRVTEDIVDRITSHFAKTYEIRNLCLSGGVALNCVANGKILKKGHYKNIWIQPASGDAGSALGAALAAYYLHHGAPRTVGETDSMQGAYLGPRYANDVVETYFNQVGAKYEKLNDADLIQTTASLLAREKAVGWFQGRMEFGPRALGARSIVADPRSETMQKRLNLKVKYRESFRPFAPSILKEEVSNWFALEQDSPYMLLVAEIAQDKMIPMTQEEQALFGIEKLNIKRSSIPAVTHVDYSARIQTVDRQTNPRYYDLLSAFKALTGCPVLVNTSFNVRGEPLVCTPEDAFKCFMGTELDILVINNYILYKTQQDPALKSQYLEKFALD